MQLSNIISRLRGESRTVGIDIGHRLIRVAVVSHKQGAKGTLLALEHDTIPEGVVVDNEIRNISGLIDKIQDLFYKAMPGGVSGDFVMSLNWTSGILCDKIVVKPVPKVPENELILQNAMGRSPFDDAGNVLDFSVLERRSDGTEAMIVAVKKDTLNSWLNLFQALNIKLYTIDVDAFVLSNAYYSAQASAPSSSEEEGYDEEEGVLLLNLGYSKSYAAYLCNGYFNAGRSIMGGAIQDLQEQLSGTLGVSAEQCSKILMGERIVNADLDEFKIKSTMEFVFEEIAMKVDTALRYFSSSDSYRSPSKMLITGGGAGIAGLSSFLSDRLSLEVVKLNPFNAVNIDANKFADIDFNKASNIYTVALGLALRRF